MTHLAFRSLVLATCVPSLALAGAPAAFKPDPALVAYAKDVVGTWTCTGKVSDDGTRMLDTTATLVNELDLGSWWIASRFTAKFAGVAYEQTAHTSFVAPAGAFRRLVVDNVGGSEVATAHRIAGGLACDGESHVGITLPNGASVVKTRHRETIAKTGYHLVGEMSLDGKTYLTTYDLTCTR